MASDTISNKKSSCYRCRISLNDDDTALIHLAACHAIDFVELMRTHRLPEFFPNATPGYFDTIYEDNDQLEVPVDFDENSEKKSTAEEDEKTKAATTKTDENGGQQKSLGGNSETSKFGETSGLSKNYWSEPVTSLSESTKQSLGELENVSSSSEAEAENEKSKDKNNESIDTELQDEQYNNNDGDDDVFRENNETRSALESGERTRSAAESSYKELSAIYSSGGRDSRWDSEYDERERTRSKSRSKSISESRKKYEPILRSRSRSISIVKKSNSSQRSRSTSTSRSRTRTRSRSRCRSYSRSKSRSPVFRTRSYSTRRQQQGRFQRGHRFGSSSRPPNRSGYIFLPYTHRHCKLIDPTNRGESIRCLYCGVQLPDFQAALTHEINYHSNRRIYRCGIPNCPFLAMGDNELANHFQQTHRVGPTGKPLLDCQLCTKNFANVFDYVAHVVGEYRRLRRIHYEQVGLRAMDVRCTRCDLIVQGHAWPKHWRICGIETRKSKIDDEGENWIEPWEKFCKHRNTPCQFFPSCSNISQCRFSHPVCAHYPDCKNHGRGKCSFDHNLADRKCRSCYSKK